jgi:diguanylate cyclase (GGDEF)-like protein
MKSSIRQDDRAARLGGDEFVALLFLDDMSVAERAADKIRLGIQGFKPSTDVQPEVPLSCSIGIAFSSNSSVSYQTIMSRADKACYQSKARGKNQYTVDRVN